MNFEDIPKIDSAKEKNVLFETANNLSISFEELVLEIDNSGEKYVYEMNRMKKHIFSPVY